MESNKKEGGIVQLVVVLGLITFICALLLGVINGVTKDKIDQNKVETRNEAMAEIIPDAEFEDMNTALSADEVAAAGVTLPAGRTAAQIDGVYKATKDGQDVGYCVQVEPKGFDDRRHQCGRHRCRRKGYFSRRDPGPRCEEPGRPELDHPVRRSGG